MTDQLSLQDAADHLGVHYMTVYRYVRRGLLTATKDGDRWTVEPDDLEAFKQRREGGGPAAARGRRAPADWAGRYESRLVAGDQNGAWGVLEEALGSGADVVDLYLDVIAPAMRSIGEGWAAGEIDIAVEHRATVVSGRTMTRLVDRFRRPGRTRGTLVLGAAAGDRHGLPVAMVADLARLAGFEVDDLGADVPAGSFALAASSAARFVAVGISVTLPGNEDAVRAAVEAVHEAVPGIPVLVGGGAMASADEAAAVGADEWAADGRGVVEVLDRLT